MSYIKATFDQCNTSMLNKSVNLIKKKLNHPKLLNGSMSNTPKHSFKSGKTHSY